jgi:hypothetical protein
VLAFGHHDCCDLAGDVRRDQHLLGAHLSIVGRDIASAGQMEAEAR